MAAKSQICTEDDFNAAATCAARMLYPSVMKDEHHIQKLRWLFCDGAKWSFDFFKKRMSLLQDRAERAEAMRAEIFKTSANQTAKLKQEVDSLASQLARAIEERDLAQQHLQDLTENVHQLKSMLD
jgi:hypothetical protein